MAARRPQGEAAIIYGGVLLLFFSALGFALSRMAFPFDTGHFEGGVWMPARMLMASANPWAPAVSLEPPYVMAPYGPLYYAAIGTGLHLFGPQFWFGRLLSIVAWLGLLGLLFSVSRASGAKGARAWLAAIFFLVQLPTLYWLAFQRPDWLALFFGFAAVGMVLGRGLASPVARVSWRRLFLLILLLSAAFFLRQTSVVPIAMAFAGFLVDRRFREIGRLFLGLILVIGGAIWFLDVVSGGGFVWQQFRLAGSVPTHFDNLKTHLSMLAQAPVSSLFIILLLARLVFLGRFDDPLRRALRGLRRGRIDSAARFEFLIWVYLLAATTLAALTAARDGSNLNYWLEAGTALSLVAASACREFQRRGGPGFVVSGVVVLFCLGAIGPMQFVWSEEQRRWAGVDGGWAAVDAIRSRVPQDGRVITAWPEIAEYADRVYWFNDGIQYDGRSAIHREVFDRVRQSGRIDAWVGATPWQPPCFGPRLRPAVHMNSPYPLYLFFRSGGCSPGGVGN